MSGIDPRIGSVTSQFVYVLASVVMSMVALIGYSDPAQAEVAGPECKSPFCPKPGDDQLTRASKTCGFLAVMSTDSLIGPKQVAARSYAGSVYNICLVHEMPPDWPEASTTLQQGREMFHDAHAKVPDLTDPESLFDKIRKQQSR